MLNPNPAVKVCNMWSKLLISPTETPGPAPPAAVLCLEASGGASSHQGLSPDLQSTAVFPSSASKWTDCSPDRGKHQILAFSHRGFPMFRRILRFLCPSGMKGILPGKIFLHKQDWWYFFIVKAVRNWETEGSDGREVRADVFKPGLPAALRFSVKRLLIVCDFCQQLPVKRKDAWRVFNVQQG